MGRSVRPGPGSVRITFNGTAKNINVPASMTGLPALAEGTMAGTITGNNVSLTFTQAGPNGVVLALNGTVGIIDKSWQAQGKTGGKYAGGNWHSSLLACLAVEQSPDQAPPAAENAPPPADQAKPQPDISAEPVIGGLVVRVTDKTGVASRCHYDSELVDRDFDLGAKATASIRIVPAVPLFKNWTVTVTCDNGASRTTDIFF